MSASQGCTDDTAVVESFKEALKQRIGADRFRMWFTHGVTIAIDNQESATSNVSTVTTGCVTVRVRGQFALDRLRANFMRELRGAAMQVCGEAMEVSLRLDEPPAMQTELPLESEGSAHDRKPHATTSHGSSPVSGRRSGGGKDPRGGRGRTQSISSLIADGAGTSRRRPKPKYSTDSGSNPTAAQQLSLPSLASPPAVNDNAAVPSATEEAAAAAESKAAAAGRVPMTAANFVIGPSNQLAHTAMVMVSQNPGMASPLFLCGPTGCGKSHLLASIADQFRRRHRMRRVMHLSAEQFTNDFISSVGNSGITSFRRRYREVDALLIDDVQFLGSKKATLREMLYTVETLADAGRPLVFSGLQSPTEIQGLSRELAGRMAAGLVCPIQPLDTATRETIFRRWVSERCPIELPDAMFDRLVPMLAGDGRVISGVVNMINTLQRMYGRVPTMDELHRFCGELLRAAKPVATIAVIESAVCEAFHLPPDTLRQGSQTRAVTEPRMLAMYLSRQMTSSAYAEIAKYFGGKSHSTAIAAEKNVQKWLEKGKAIGRGHAAISVQEAVDRVENLLRSG